MAPTTIDFLPSTLSSLLPLADDATATATAAVAAVDPATLRAQLRRIPRSTWLRLGCKCHNTSFASDIASILTTKPAASSVSMFSTAAAAAKAAALLFDNGMPRIVRTIQRHQMRGEGHGHGEPLLWAMYNVYTQRFPNQFIKQVDSGNKRKGTGGGGGGGGGGGSLQTSRISSSLRSSASLIPPGQIPWQFHFLKSACPEVMIKVFVDTFLGFGRKHGYERDFPIELAEAVDFEWRSSSGPARRAVLALIQTLIACRRYAKSNNSGGGVSSKLTLTASKSAGAELEKSSGASNTAIAVTADQQNSEQEIDAASHQLALNLSEACVALETFFETERGRSLPKLLALFQQEVAADTKLQSRSGPGTGGDRGIKRPGGGVGALGGDSSDLAARKRLKSSGAEPPVGALTVSNITSATTTGEAVGLSSPLLASSTITVPTSAGEPGESTLRSSAWYVEQALTGYNAVATAAQPTATSTTLSSINSQQQAKLSNPLWSPIMGLVHLPQFPTKYAAQVDFELERWITLLGHMDGAVFSDRLVGLIKSVYPSDQKFLLDQILIDYMCWEGNGGQERDVEEAMVPAAQYLKESSLTRRTAGTGVRTGKTRADIKTGEFVMETIMSALVGLVIKPEESSTFLEAGSKKWTEPLEMPKEEEEAEQGDKQMAGTGATSATAATTEVTTGAASEASSSATSTSATSAATATAASFRTSSAMGGAKKRRVRNLYNRRVSPFYAVLAMFQPKRVVGRITGMLYLAPEDLEANNQKEEEQQLLKQVAETPSILKTPTVVEVEEPDQALVRVQSKRAKKKKHQEKKMAKMAKMKRRYEDKYRAGGKIDLDAEEKIDPRVRSTMVSTKMDIDGQAMNAEAMLAVWEAEPEEEATTAKEGEDDDEGGINKEDEEDEDAASKAEGSEAAVKKEDDGEGDAMEGIEHEQEQEQDTSMDAPQQWMKETMDKDALELAKQVEASRIKCQAPFRVLMFILQYLTRMNQGGALDSWITDALSATVQKLQVQYFDWVLASLILPQAPTSRPTMTDVTTGATSDHGEHVVFEEDLLRLLAVLVAAQGIGYEPMKIAFQDVETAYRARQPDSWAGGAEGAEGVYWPRVRAMLEGQ
ncbi:hypothetical protein EDD21DRAFT_190334 [Dissophora ornata]|nr:hypothetical protein BGZ58_006057 [Dissophora ornata]KAI8598335.1 hypothetical protein EDD21DRAFT_190334 [Dissophora ornata]